jgi:hypothetical protein
MSARLSYLVGCLRRVAWVVGGVVCAAAGAQVTQPSPIFGFVRTTLNGTGTQGGVTMVGPTFVEGVVEEATLQAGAPRPFELTVVGKTWGAGIFATHPEASSHYVEVKSSSNLLAIGQTSEIVSHTTNTLRIAGDWSAVLRGGETLVIRPHKTLGGLFGPANEAGLGGGDALSADILSVLHEGAAASFSTYYYRTANSALGGTGWRSSANPINDESKRPIRTGQGLIVKRRRAEPLEVMLQGFVKTGIWRRALPTGYALVDPLAPVTDQRASEPLSGPAFVLGTSPTTTAVPSGLVNVLAPGTPQTADLVSLAGTMASIYVASPTGLSSGGWRLTSNPLADQQNAVIPSATAILIQNRGTTKQWARPQPFVVSSP